jgi:hypothetical protein
MLRSQSIRVLITLALAAGAAAQAHGKDDLLHLRVGPGVNATFSLEKMRAACGDNAVCQFDVPSNAAFDIVANGRPSRDYRWTGCTAQPEPDRCRVEIRSRAVLVTVR